MILPCSLSTTVIIQVPTGIISSKCRGAQQLPPLPAEIISSKRAFPFPVENPILPILFDITMIIETGVAPLAMPLSACRDVKRPQPLMGRAVPAEPEVARRPRVLPWPHRLQPQRGQQGQPGQQGQCRRQKVRPLLGLKVERPLKIIIILVVALLEAAKIVTEAPKSNRIIIFIVPHLCNLIILPLSQGGNRDLCRDTQGIDTYLIYITYLLRTMDLCPLLGDIISFQEYFFQF